jgi:hypothetical protein
MLTQTRRLAMVTALLWYGFGVGGQAEASTVLMTPAGLSPGDHFRFVFVTDGTTAATSSSIDFYNNFVNTQAGGATYNGNVVTWSAIASTPTVAAIDNVGQTQDPVYLADGTKVTTTTTTTGLWSGTLLHAINEDLTPTVANTRVWTGTNPTGREQVQQLGINPAVYGSTAFADNRWVDLDALTINNTFPLYGISSDLLVPQAAVPEPTSLWMMGTGISAGLAYGWSRHRRDQRRQRPVGPPDETEW